MFSAYSNAIDSQWYLFTCPRTAIITCIHVFEHLSLRPYRIAYGLHVLLQVDCYVCLFFGSWRGNVGSLVLAKSDRQLSAELLESVWIINRNKARPFQMVRGKRKLKELSAEL